MQRACRETIQFRALSQIVSRSSFQLETCILQNWQYDKLRIKMLINTSAEKSHGISRKISEVAAARIMKAVRIKYYFLISIVPS